ncbi:4'-phosphopantetheinyl transferase family protein [Riemerella columbipharyngis]|uniref:4'-phosphopantetheinyl transferase superfamily protein n=1 Tax=Riemerella columbipharyngis TaxID=1071918 RepID=A0A1G6ZM49_9FLAO|nr:4'-phosphopantetheinyl transferase superfamily protein [Riemerella columbipharyngis]SDE03679.1 4'-phosphopantetheinyl transferase superfamily protein [Riemerella columbipharyngis]
MPLYKELSFGTTAILIWKHHKTDDIPILEAVSLDDLDSKPIINPKKIIEKKMIKAMLQSVLPNHQLKHYTDGSPFVEIPSTHISISHSYPFAVLAVSNKKIGVDIEKISDRILKLKDKFLSPEEKEWLSPKDDTEQLTEIWCIKESLYKIHPEKFWSLKKYYQVMPYTNKNTSPISCKVLNNGQTTHYNAKIEHIEDYILSVVTA